MYTKHPYAERSVMSHALAPLFTLTCGLKGKSVYKRVMWITYQQPVDNYKSAILCISLATFYILTRYNKALFNEVGDPEMRNTLLVVLIFTLMLFADSISNGICSLIFIGG